MGNLPAHHSRVVNPDRRHGAGAGASRRPRNGMYRHGGRTKQAQAERRYLSELMRAARDLMRGLSD